MNIISRNKAMGIGQTGMNVDCECRVNCMNGNVVSILQERYGVSGQFRSDQNVEFGQLSPRIGDHGPECHWSILQKTMNALR